MGLKPANEANWNTSASDWTKEETWASLASFANCLGKAGNTQDTVKDIRETFNYLINNCSVAFFKTKRHLDSSATPFAVNLRAWSTTESAPPTSAIKKFATDPSELGRKLEELFGTLGVTKSPAALKDYALWDPVKFWRNTVDWDTTEFAFTSTRGRYLQPNTAPTGTKSNEVVKFPLNELWHFRQRSSAVSSAGSLSNARCRMTRVSFCKFVVSLTAPSLDQTVFEQLRNNYDDTKLTLWPKSSTSSTVTTILKSRYLTLNRFLILDAKSGSLPKDTVAECDQATRTAAAKLIYNKLVSWNLWDSSVPFPGQTVPNSTALPMPEWNLDLTKN
jgi:hypothetical protein